jgi:signal transduction histidine kinase/DNA-binding response OmpR family regulator
VPQPILTIALRTEADVVQARQRARELAALLGFDNQDQIRLATATSEMARNAFRYARNGIVRFSAITDVPQQLEVIVSDSGPGIPNLEDILDGHYKSETGLGMGIIGTKRLMDNFAIKATSSGTTVQMSKQLPRRAPFLSSAAVRSITSQLHTKEAETPYAEIERQNQDLLKTLQELRARQDELLLLNRELEDTNRGVVALYAELDERADYLRRASELKTKFLSNVSHEFRTPLNSIISLGRLLLERVDGDLTSEQEKQVRFIESSARDLEEMVNDLLDLAKVEAGKIKIRPKAFDVSELFSALKGMLKPLLADNTSVDLIFEETAHLPPMYTDEGKVSQILRNLVSNALKFTPRGTVTVRAKQGNPGSIRFEVTDTGIGIPAEHHETVFREFSQVENPLQERHRGTGLGLPLCRNLALLLGGRIWLESELGRGSAFFADIPVVYSGESAEQASGSPAPEFHRAPVLILEDDQNTAALYESYLRHSEFQPIVVADVTRAKVWIERHSPEAVLADVYIGEEPSWDFIHDLREMWPALSLIVTSVHDESQRAFANGATTFLAKPFSRETLLAELRHGTVRSGPRRLLLVDDNEVSRYIVRELLDRPWLDISEARNGTEAIEMIRDHQPDGVILDLLMPDISGMEVLRRLREQATTADLPVVVFTSKPLTDSEKKSLENLDAGLIRKEDVSTRLSAQPFLEWLTRAGLTPTEPTKPNV